MWMKIMFKTNKSTYRCHNVDGKKNPYLYTPNQRKQYSLHKHIQN